MFRFAVLVATTVAAVSALEDCSLDQEDEILASTSAYCVSCEGLTNNDVVAKCKENNCGRCNLYLNQTTFPSCISQLYGIDLEADRLTKISEYTATCGEYQGNDRGIVVPTCSADEEDEIVQSTSQYCLSCNVKSSFDPEAMCEVSDCASCISHSKTINFPSCMSAQYQMDLEAFRVVLIAGYTAACGASRGILSQDVPACSADEEDEIIRSMSDECLSCRVQTSFDPNVMCEVSDCATCISYSKTINFPSCVSAQYQLDLEAFRVILITNYEKYCPFNHSLRFPQLP